MPVSHFFDEMPVNVLVGSRRDRGRGGAAGGDGSSPSDEKDPLTKRETLELVRAYYKIDEGKVRKRVFEMVKAVGSASKAYKQALAGKHKGTK